MSNIININEMIGRNLKGISYIGDVRYSTMNDAQIQPSGWRELGLYMSGSHGHAQPRYATVSRGGTIVG